jgi:hypothetical protein
MVVLTRNAANFCKNYIRTLVLKKTYNFFSRKLAMIAENGIHNIDP